MGKKKEAKENEEVKQKQVEEKKEAKQADEVPAHDDAAEDIALFKKLLKDYGVIDSEEPTEGEVEMAKEAHGHAKAMGLQGEEAEKCAGYALKMAKHVAKSKQNEESEAEVKKENDECKENEEKKETKADMKKECKEADEVEESEKDKKDEDEAKHKESAISLLAENAKLKESLAKYQLNEKIETLLKESKVPMKHTKVLKDKFLKECKSIDEAKKVIGVYMEAFKNTGGEAGEFGMNIVINPEKSNHVSAKSLSFSDCLK